MASDIRPLTDKKTGKVRAKVALKPGFGLMDWMRLPLSQHRPRPITMAELKEHKTKFDCWTALNGRVYNITQYLDYHPGGVPILMKAGGKDGTALFNKYHAWVNIDGMLAKCFIGVLVDDGTASIGEEEEVEEEEGKEVVSSAAVLQQLQIPEEEGEGEGEGEGQVSGSLLQRIRVNPGLQNLAAGGTVHDATANDTASSASEIPEI